MKKGKIIRPLLTALTLGISLYLANIVKGGTDLEWGLVLAYSTIGIGGFIFTAILEALELKLASILFLLGSLAAGIYLYLAMPSGPESFSQLAVFIGWLMLMALVILLTVALGIYMLVKRKKEKSTS